MKPEDRPREVSCLALTFFYDYLEMAGIPRTSIQADLPYEPEYLNNRLNWIDTDTYLEVERRLASYFDDPDLYYKVGTTFQSTGGIGFVRVLFRAVTSPFQVYRQIPRLLPRFLFRNLSIQFERTGRSRLRAVYEWKDQVPSEAWVDTARGVLTSIPAMMGAPPAEVVITERGPRHLVFELSLFKWLGPVEYLRGLFERVRTVFRLRLNNVREAKTELEESNALLQEKLEALTHAKAELATKVRDLSILNQLAVQATSQIDVRKLVRSAVDVISRELGRACVVTLVDGDESALIVAGTAGLSRDEQANLDEVLDLDGWTAARVAALPDPAIELAGGRWLALHLRGRERDVGALLLRHAGESDDFDPALYTSIANQLAVGLDNAVSYRVIADLRDNLEIRVQSRTAQLEQARVELEDTVVRLEEADKAKREFFMNVSHELKTPLTLIMAPLDELRDAGLDDGGRRKLGGLRSNAEALLRLVEELLDFSQLDEGRMTVKRMAFDLGRFIGDIVSSLDPLAVRRGITMRYHRPDEPVAISAEPRLIKRVLRNLVTNAIKYIDDGDSIDVRLDLQGDQVRIEVADTGPGIPPEQAEKVFERFYRCSSDRERRVKGSGIGLAMARELVELHDGALGLVTAPGEGCTFHVTLPVGATAGAALLEDDEIEEQTFAADALQALMDADGADAEAPTAPPDARRVLVVEDNPEMQALVARVLGGRYQVLTADDGREGLAAARRELPDLVLSDISMPNMTGYELCRALKADPRTQNIPVVLVTARHGTAAALEGFDAGADDYVVKPFAPQELLARVDAQIRLRSLTLALVRTEKQASLGVMSAGIAHEVLNPVNVVINAVAPLRKAIERMQSGDRVAASAQRADRMLEIIHSSGERIWRVVEAVLAIARHDGDKLELREATMSKHIGSVLTLLGYRLGDRVTVSCDLDPDDRLWCYPDLLDQVVMNLVGNALDAIGDEPGEVVVRTERLDDVFEITVRDSGPGIPASLRERIFTPFFTTKEPGKGTGLGLSLSREILDIHAGSLELVRSEPGCTELRVTVPVRDGPVTEEPTPEDASDVPDEAVARAERSARQDVLVA